MKSLGVGVLLFTTASLMTASEPEWGPSRVKDCIRECLDRAHGRWRGCAVALQSGTDLL